MSDETGACQSEFFLAETYSPYSAGRIKCRRRSGHPDSHMASLRVKIRGVRDDVILDVPWPIQQATSEATP